MNIGYRVKMEGVIGFKKILLFLILKDEFFMKSFVYWHNQQAYCPMPNQQKVAFDPLDCAGFWMCLGCCVSIATY